MPFVSLLVLLSLFGVFSIPFSLDQTIGILELPKDNEILALRSTRNCPLDNTGIQMSYFRDGRPFLLREVSFNASLV
jgi:hypothetical protein